MPTIQVAWEKVHTFAQPAAFYQWLADHHDREDEVWIRIYKLKSGHTSINPQQTIETALCWGWIDSIRKRHDDVSFLQRYCHRRATSNWSVINANTVMRLAAEGQMAPPGLEAVSTGFARGKWPLDCLPDSTLRRALT